MSNMNYSNPRIAEVAAMLFKRLEETEDKSSILRATELHALYAEIPTLAQEERGAFGKELNMLKTELTEKVAAHTDAAVVRTPFDVTAPYDENITPKQRPTLLGPSKGSKHPLMAELEIVLDIFSRMGFDTIESRQIDDEYHMFDSLNFPAEHPARDDYDTFMTTDGFIAPAHASIMQNRILKDGASSLDKGKEISAVYAGRTFRNEDVDARHEHTFYQVEIMHVGKSVTAGNLIATFKTFLEEYYAQELEVKSQPYYFPFTEPSFELALSCPFCKKAGCHVCSYSGWIELLGMGLVHPNVLRQGGIDPDTYTGFAGGLGLDRLVMMKYGIEDVRLFHSGKLEFLRQFS